MRLAACSRQTPRGRPTHRVASRPTKWPACKISFREWQHSWQISNRWCSKLSLSSSKPTKRSSWPASWRRVRALLLKTTMSLLRAPLLKTTTMTTCEQRSEKTYLESKVAPKIIIWKFSSNLTKASFLYVRLYDFGKKKLWSKLGYYYLITSSTYLIPHYHLLPFNSVS